jgi:hypothetical protein
VRERIPDGVAAHLNRLYYDVAQSAAPLSLRALLDIADPSRIFFGTDYPFARKAEKVLKDTIAGVENFAGFADDAFGAKVVRERAGVVSSFRGPPLTGRTTANRQTFPARDFMNIGLVGLGRMGSAIAQPDRSNFGSWPGTRGDDQAAAGAAYWRGECPCGRRGARP